MFDKLDALDLLLPSIAHQLDHAVRLKFNKEKEKVSFVAKVYNIVATVGDDKRVNS